MIAKDSVCHLRVPLEAGRKCRALVVWEVSPVQTSIASNIIRQEKTKHRGQQKRPRMLQRDLVLTSRVFSSTGNFPSRK